MNKESSLEIQAGTQMSPVRAWMGVAILWWFYVLALMDRGAIALMVGPMMTELSISAVQMGILQGFAFAGFYVAAGFPLGWATDRVSRRKLLLAGILVWSAATIGCGLASSYAEMLVARALVGAGEAVLIPTSLSLIADMFPRDRIGRATAVFSSGATVGAGAALIIGGALLHVFQVHDVPAVISLAPWRVVFVVFGAVGFVAAWLSLVLPEGVAHIRCADNIVTDGQFVQFLKRHAVLLICVLLGFPFLLAGMVAFMSWTPRHLETAYNWNIATIGIAMGALKIVITPLGVICGGFAIDKAMRRGVSAAQFTVPIISTLIGAPILAAGLLQTNGAFAVVLMCVGMFLYSAFASSQYVVLQLLAPAAMRGRLTGLYVVAMTLIGTGLGAVLPPLIGTLREAHGANIGSAIAYVLIGVSGVAVALLGFGRTRLQAALMEQSVALPGGASQQIHGVSS